MERGRYIQLYGTPSTTFLHIKRVIESVIEKANLSLTLREVTNLSDILDAKIGTVPTLKIRDKVFTFSERTSVNLKLKDAIKYLLQIHNYGDWSCIALPISRN
ncbi:MAG: hypothetical protein GVX78_00530, partial [Bacteroidetes bacterium]|nr:hypothetical protein [Bacteroidota bacterium]